MSLQPANVEIPAGRDSTIAAPITNAVTMRTPPQALLVKLPAIFTAGLLLFTFLQRADDSARLRWTFVGVATVMAIWQLILRSVARRRGQTLTVEFVPISSHYVQAFVQFSIMIWWGWFAPEVYLELPLILSQVMFLYILEGLVTWSRGRTWRIGFGPLPIIFSTNLLLWFKDDWYFFQFAMVALGAFAKQFITWERNGRRSHIFNPSAFGQFLFALGLIFTGTTNDLTWGKQIAASFETPHMLIVIFLGGLLVQYLFHVTLMTLAAMSMLIVLNLGYTQATGLYFFVNVNIAAPIFLGLHLLITDPATSPRTNLGRVIFGALYGTGYFVLFRVLDIYEVPLFWDKLLPVPILNLCVPMIEKLARSGFVGRFNQWWESTLQPKRLNLVHMACWAAVFGGMYATGYIEAPHPGNSIPFWKKAFAENRMHAGHSLVLAAGAQAEGGHSGAAYNELGLICMEGKIVRKNHGAAARHFASACELGNVDGCLNVVIQHLFLNEAKSESDVTRALTSLEAVCDAESNWASCFLLGKAYETGRGRPRDLARAIALFEKCGKDNLYAAKGIARIALLLDAPSFVPTGIEQILVQASVYGDSESCWYLAYMYDRGIGVAKDTIKSRRFLETACRLGEKEACNIKAMPSLPPFSNPRMLLPNWFTAFPLPPASAH